MMFDHDQAPTPNGIPNLNLPPPPTLAEVLTFLPEGFMPHHPATDRLATAIGNWKSTKEIVINQQQAMENLLADLTGAANLLSAVEQGIDVSAEIAVFLARFRK